MTKEELLKLVHSIPDNSEILLKDKKEYGEFILEKEEIISETWEEYDRSSDEMRQFSRDVNFYGQKDKNLKNKREVYSLQICHYFDDLK